MLTYIIATLIDIYFILIWNKINYYYDKVWMLICVVGHLFMWIHLVNNSVNWSLWADNILWFVVLSGLGLHSVYLIVLCILTILGLILLEQYNKKCILTGDEWCAFNKQSASIAIPVYMAKLFYNLSE